MLLPVLLTLFTTLFPVQAHFKLKYPESRGFDDDNLGNGPCGGFDTPSDRTPVSTTSLALDLEMGHDQSAMQVLLGLGDDPGANFNITLLPTFRQEGLGEFCLREVPLPSDLGIEDGMNATLQVVTNGDPSGGLYNCADITFTTGTVAPPSSCANGTGVTASPFPPEAAARNANESTPRGQPQEGTSGGSEGGSDSESPTSSATGATVSPTGAAAVANVGCGMLGVALVGAVVLL